MNKILYLLFATVLMAMINPGPIRADESTGYYRFWRGFKIAGMTSARFRAQLASRFMPATVKINAGKGLVSYTVAVPPSEKPSVIPDEFALVAYESEEKYRKQASSPEGQRYGRMHWDIFDSKTSKSIVPVRFHELNPDIISADVAYDLVDRSTNWQQGYVTFIIGLRREDVAPADFLKRVTSHLKKSAELFSRYELQGYLVLTTDDYHVAYIKWPSKVEADKALSSCEINEQVVKRSRLFMSILQNQAARSFDGTVRDGDFINVKF